jgi:enoyl-CoA hydratase/carnithine racemase
MTDRTPQDLRINHPAPGVVQLTLHRLEVRNALRTQTLAEIAAELTAATSSDALRAVVLTGDAKS